MGHRENDSDSTSLGQSGRQQDCADRKAKNGRRNIIPYNPALKELARQLRNNSTASEIKLWKEIKGRFLGKYDFHRQKPLDNYIADFYCYELKLVIEIDGCTHNHPEVRRNDWFKEKRFSELGLYILRFSDRDIIMHMESSLDLIRMYVDAFENCDLTRFRYEGTPLNPLVGVINDLNATHP